MNSSVRLLSSRRRPLGWPAPLARLAVTVLVSVFAVSACGGDDTVTNPTPPYVGPTITAVSPSSGASLGGTQIAVTGTNFADGATVSVGGVQATSVRVTGASTLTAVTGPHAPGLTDVVVAVGGQSATLSAAFLYVAVPANAMPVISSVTVQGTRPNEPANFADINEEVVVTAVVTDAETPVSQLTYEWSADIGTITSTSGATARWRAPASIAAPVMATITVRVTEVIATVTGAAGPAVVTQTAVGTGTASVHNSLKEIGDMSRQFLLDFSNSSLSPEYVVRDFWDGCPGKAEELQDVRTNRANWLITSYKIGEPTSVSVNFSSACVTPNRPSRPGDGCSVVPCEWHDVYKPTGQTGTTIGPDYLSAVYRNNRWWLCSSDFPSGTITTPVNYPAFIR